MTPTIREISVDNRLEQLVEIYDGLEAFAQEIGLAVAVKNRLFLVVEELFTNLVRYGYADGGSDFVTLGFAREGEVVRLTIRDHATKFDVSQPPKTPSPDADLESTEIGGLGLFLVHELARTVSNWSEGSTNVTELIIDAEP